MTDIASLVLGIPSFVEGFVKVGRAVMKYKSLEQDHTEIIEKSIFIAGVLVYYAGFVNVDDPRAQNHASRPLLEQALQNADSALRIADGILNSWSQRLAYESKDAIRTISKRLAQSVGSAFICGKNALHNSAPGVKITLKAFTKASYLAFGAVTIKDAMLRVKFWTDQLSQLLLTSPALRIEGCRIGADKGQSHGAMSDDVAFVAHARKRIESNKDVVVIDRSHTESMFDIDPLHNCNIYRIPDGDYAGYIVDIRNLFLSRDSIFEDEARDTEHICRLFADTPSDGDYKARATVGVLPCAGYAVSETRTMHLLLFRLPSGTGTPKTLRSLLLSGTSEHALNERLDFCVKLATSVLIIQSLGLVHKNIRPDSIIVTRPLSSSPSPDALGTPYLLSFGQARLAAGPTGKRPYIGEALARTLYVHPRHLASRRRKKYQMRDDIYSLGLCFLEVAIWKSLLIWNPKENGFVCDFDVCQISDDHYEDVLKEEGMPIEHDKCWLRRDTLVGFARKHVPRTMGKTFADVVVGCLLFGEEELSYKQTLEKTHEVDPHDEEADSQSVMFVQDILTKLRGLVFAA